ncbi:hypothetical protein [Candidatus Halobonum tyrrellensis]|uniref:Uncharacterized protein n=1 Tax=Candidatus Halobonum tyrrellensis G22 TaxID=1324957 RepID=V4HHQ7_9EURY|nr:hypothetical protein [Candidatus Halobonum tyrrellensis]ESP87439.1 hypothetical protein K933_14228 [Candidatus Halobonum tyrrellensis G22]
MSEETGTGGGSVAKETVKRGAKSGAFAAASGGITLVRAMNALRKRQWKRAGVRLLAAGFWFGVAAVQRRMSSGGSDDLGPSADVDQREVVDTSPDLGDVATDADEGTGTESHGDPSDVVDPMSTDIDESDTATELDSDVDPSDVEERDVASTGVDAEDAAEATDDEADDEREEPAHTANAHVVGEEDGTEADADDEHADDEHDGAAGPRELDDDAEPAISESAADDEGEEQAAE